MSARVTILGVPVDPLTLPQAVNRVIELLTSGVQHHVITPNPEMIVAAQKNSEFLRVLQSSSLNIADGAGLLFAARMTGQCLPERVTGTDLLIALAHHAEAGPMFLLGAGPGIAERAAHALMTEHPSVSIAGTFGGSPREEDEDDIVRRINDSGARILFVAYGAPAQELWISRVLPRLCTVTVAVGVGGAFDFLAGVRSRAPGWMRRIGLEWLWRLVQEPSRIGRICTAVIVFPFLVLTKPSRS